MYAQNSILCQFGNLEICPNFANPYLTQFSSISGGNCISLKKGPNLPGPIFPTLPIFRTIFYLNNYSLRDPHLHTPRFFIFATHICDSISRLTFATPFRDSHSRPPICDSHSRPTFATPVRDHTRDSRSRLPIALPTATRHFLSRLPSCDSTTDRWTVLTPQRHLPSVPTLTLIKKTSFFGTYSLACPPPLAPTNHHVHTPQWLCVP